MGQGAGKGIVIPFIEWGNNAYSMSIQKKTECTLCTQSVKGICKGVNDWESQ